MNAILGIARPGDFGADMMHFNPHKTFSGPHGGGGPGAGPIAVRSKLEPYLPVPTVERNGDRYKLVYDRPKSIGRVRSFFGNVGVLVRAYCYIRTYGPAGLRQRRRERRPQRQLLAQPGEAYFAGAARRSLLARVRRHGGEIEGRARSVGDGCRQAAVGLRLPRADGLFSA